MSRLMPRILLAVALLLAATSTQAQFATGGIGLHKPRVFWLSWGPVGQNVYAGVTISRNFNVAGYNFNSSCTLSNATTTAGLVRFNPFTTQTVEGVHWRKSSTFGQPRTALDIQTPRTFRFSVGFRF